MSELYRIKTKIEREKERERIFTLTSIRQFIICISKVIAC